MADAGESLYWYMMRHVKELPIDDGAARDAGIIDLLGRLNNIGHKVLQAIAPMACAFMELMVSLISPRAQGIAEERQHGDLHANNICAGEDRS